MKTLKFKLYQSKRNRHLKRSINAAGVIYNHCIALHKRYYRMWGKHLNCAKLQSQALLNTGMNSRFPNCYKPSMVSFVTSSEKLIHTVNQQRPIAYCQTQKA